MRPILIGIAVALMLSGCASMEKGMSRVDWGEVNNQMYGPNGYMNDQNQQHFGQQRQPQRQTDMRCLRACRAQGYQYGLCQSKCSY